MPVPWATPRALRARNARIMYLNLRNPMKQQLPLYEGLTVNVEAFLGLTTWQNAAENPPPHTGWWKTRRVSSPELLQPQRRWWGGKSFSKPVLLVDSDEDSEDTATEITEVPLSDIEWCGLTAPHPAGYTYNFYRF